MSVLARVGLVSLTLASGALTRATVFRTNEKLALVEDVPGLDKRHKTKPVKANGVSDERPLNIARSCEGFSESDMIFLRNVVVIEPAAPRGAPRRMIVIAGGRSPEFPASRGTSFTTGNVDAMFFVRKRCSFGPAVMVTEPVRLEPHTRYVLRWDKEKRSMVVKKDMGRRVEVVDETTTPRTDPFGRH